MTTPPPPTSHRRGSLPTALALLVSALLLGACGSGADGDTLAADAPLPTQVPEGTTLVVADQSEAQQVALKASGELAKLPFTVEFANFTGGPAILEAFRAGAADIATVGDTPPIHALVAGEDVPIVLAKQNDPRAYRLAVAPGVSIRALADLRGAKIAYAEGTAQQVIVLRALEKAGLKTSDVQLVRLQLAEYNDAVRTGQVDVAPLNEPRLTRFLRDAGPTAGVIDPEETADTSSGLGYLYARRAALQDPAKLAAIRVYIEHYVRSQVWINNHPDEWVRQYYVENQGVSAEDGKRILDTTGPSTFPRLDQALIARQQASIDVIDRAGELPKRVQAADGFDLRFDEVIAQAVPAAGGSFTPAGTRG